MVHSFLIKDFRIDLRYGYAANFGFKGNYGNVFFMFTDKKMEFDMSDVIKQIVQKEDTFDKLEIRLGQIIAVEIEPSAPKRAYKMTIDFGKFGKRTSVGRFTHHFAEELKGKKVVGILNFEPKKIGETVSQVLILGVQYPKAESGEATFITPLADAKIGGKVF